jgi:uncharacterized membrane protein
MWCRFTLFALLFWLLIGCKYITPPCRARKRLHYLYFVALLLVFLFNAYLAGSYSLYGYSNEVNIIIIKFISQLNVEVELEGMKEGDISGDVEGMWIIVYVYI